MKTGITAFLCVLCSCSSSPSQRELASTRELLHAYRSEVLSSWVDPSGRSVLSDFGEELPAAELCALFADRDPAVLELGGTFFAIVTEVAQATCMSSELEAGLEDPDPRWRAFSCEALATLGDASHVPALEALLTDQAVVPGYYADPPVAAFAATSLAHLGSDAGVPVMLAVSIRNDSWWFSYLEPLKLATGEDFGHDLDAWRRWRVSGVSQ